jgi:hypothetical protein
MRQSLLALQRRAENTRGDAPDDAIVPRLSTLPEDVVLEWFWFMAREERVDRLWLLLQLTYVAIKRPADWDPRRIRDEHDQQARGPFVVKMEAQRCFSCDGFGPLFSHHVIEIQHGGSNQLRNKVPLCFPCHQYLHPWLKEPVGRRSSEFESVREIMVRTPLGLP